MSLLSFIFAVHDLHSDREKLMWYSRLASAVQQFTYAPPETSLYGSGWDVMWLGHCGERWDRTKSSLQYPDDSRLSPDDCIDWKEASFEVIRDNHRFIRLAAGPICTFAYAITSTRARKILSLANKGRSTAFDIELSELCLLED
jgi:hypothetical protein